MKTAEEIRPYVVRHGDVMPLSSHEGLMHPEQRRPSILLLLIGGLFGIACGGFFIIEPQVGGAYAASGALVAGVVSVIVTYIARKQSS